MLRFLKWVIWAAVVAALMLVLCGLYLAGLDCGGYFLSAKGNLEEVSLDPSGSDSVYRREWLSLRSNGGLKVECGLLAPANQTGAKRYPVVILMGGKATGKHAIDYALDVKNIIIVAPDYPYTPKTSYTLSSFFTDVPEMRRAALRMIPSVMLLTDYLWSRKDVDTTRLVLLGYSFGAPFVPCIAAYDRRAAVAAMVFGGGDLHGLIRHNIRRYRGALVSELVSLTGTVLLWPLEPLRYAKAISPIPLVMINGSEDQQVPPRFAEELFKEAKEPKQLVWLKARHVNPRNVELTKQIVASLKDRLVKMNVLPSEE